MKWNNCCDLASSAASFMREDLDHNLCFHFFFRGLGGDYMRQAGMKRHCSHFCVPVIFIRDLKIITGVWRRVRDSPVLKQCARSNLRYVGGKTPQPWTYYDGFFLDTRNCEVFKSGEDSSLLYCCCNMSALNHWSSLFTSSLSFNNEIVLIGITLAWRSDNWWELQ